MRVVGIDPGSVSGAWAAICGTTILGVGDCPVTENQIDPAMLVNLLVEYHPDVIVVERVASMPKQGVSSTFRFGTAFGMIQGVAAGMAIPVCLVTPPVWRKHFGLGPDKDASRGLAARRWPHLAKDLKHKINHNRADALLVAQWFLDTKAATWSLK